MRGRLRTIRCSLRRLADTYNLDNFEEVLEQPTCVVCGKDAVQRCSRCKLEW